MKVLRLLRGTTSRLEKEKILKSCDELDIKTFYYAYNPYFTYGLKFDIKNDTSKIYAPQEGMFLLLDRLANRSLTGNSARDLVEKYAHKHGDLIKLICNKDLDCGVTATTFNKVWANTIPQFKVQLAKEIDLERISLPFIGQIKYDGVRVVAKLENNTVTFQTRNGLYFEFPELELCIKNANSDVVLDGELIFGPASTSKHTKISGIVNSALKGTPIRLNDVHFVVFDCMSIEDFKYQNCSEPYSVRYRKAKEYVKLINKPIVNLAKTMWFENYQQANNMFTDLLAKGYEGMIIKKWDHLYSFKRSKDWVKLKAIKTADLLCIDIQPGTGKYEGCIGALICKGNIEGKEIYVKVGAGLTDSQRYLPFTTFIHKVIEVKYNSTILNLHTGEYSLFLPRFENLRGDLS